MLLNSYDLALIREKIDLEERISDWLIEMGFFDRSYGFRATVVALVFMANGVRWGEGIYHKVALEFNTTSSNIQKVIRAFKLRWMKSSQAARRFTRGKEFTNGNFLTELYDRAVAQGILPRPENHVRLSSARRVVL